MNLFDSNIHYQHYNNDIQLFEISQSLQANCAQITFYNNAPVIGGASVTVNGLTLTPGQGIAFVGNDGELDVTKYTFTFSAGGINSLAVIQKNYVGISNK